MKKECYSGKYDKSKIMTGNPENIYISYSGLRKPSYYEEFSCKFIIQTESCYFINEFKEKNCVTEETYNAAVRFYAQVIEDIIPYFDVPTNYWAKLTEKGLSTKDSFSFQSDSYLNGIKKKEEEADKKAEIEKQQIEFEKQKIAEEERQQEELKGWFNLSANNIDLRLPETNLTAEQKNTILLICQSKTIILFEDFDKRYNILYFELQPSSFSESVRFAFKQIDSQEEYETIRNTKECRNCAIRVIFPVLDIISQNCEDFDENNVFDLIDGKKERLCFHLKKDVEQTAVYLSEDKIITQPIQLEIPTHAKKCSLSELKEGDYSDYSAFIVCSFDTGQTSKYKYFSNSFTDDYENNYQCPIPSDERKKAKTGVINVLQNAGFNSDFEVIEKFKSKSIKTLIMTR